MDLFMEITILMAIWVWIAVGVTAIWIGIAYIMVVKLYKPAMKRYASMYNDSEDEA